tara:strand:+ start:162 stop:1286 length:1125 start_codon:yes stop_codon:yes gene_type:complete
MNIAMETSIYDFNRGALLDKKITNAFTQKHIDTHNRLCPEDAFPEIYESLPKGIKFIGRQLKRLDTIKNDLNINPRTQGARVGGGVTAADEVALLTSFKNKGAKLRNLAPFIFEDDNGNSRYVTGHSRETVYKSYNFTHIIVNVFKRVKGATDSELQDNLEEMGIFLNDAPDACTPADSHDIRHHVQTAVNNGRIHRTYDDILERIKPLARRVGLSDRKATYLAADILNLTAPGIKSTILPMLSRDASAWCIEHKYKDINGKIKYFIRSHDRDQQGICDAIKYAYDNPKEEVRIVVFCGILTSDPIEQFKKRSLKFFNSFQTIVNTFQSVVFGGAEIQLKNLTLYGVCPQIGSEHNLTTMCLYKLDGTGKTEQK